MKHVSSRNMKMLTAVEGKTSGGHGGKVDSFSSLLYLIWAKTLEN